MVSLKWLWVKNAKKSVLSYRDAKKIDSYWNKVWQVISVADMKQIGPDWGLHGHRNLLATSFKTHYNCMELMVQSKISQRHIQEL